MVTRFEKRLESGCAFESQLAGRLVSHPNIVMTALNGTEHTHPNFVNELRRRRIDSIPSRLIRYAPDGVLLTDKDQVIHYDAKAGKSIEKNAYEAYIAFHKMGHRVILFVLFRDVIWGQDIEKLKLISGETTVDQFPLNRRFPIDENGWICPREISRFHSDGRMSGTPYREIDFSSMRKHILNVSENWPD